MEEGKVLPLSGIRVVEIGHALVGPVAAGLLGDWGADVIKIENMAGGDLIRGLMSPGSPVGIENHLYFELANHNKRAMSLDLKKPEGRDIVYKLVSQADVFVSNMRAKALRNLGMDYPVLNKINPRLVYGHNSGYGPRGPEKDKPGFDETAYWARGGFMSLLGEPDDIPSPLRGAQGDLPSAMFLASGIVLALLHRQKTGVGQQVDVSLLHSALWTNAGDIQVTMNTGKESGRVSRKAKPNPLVNIYQTKDKRWFQLAMHQSDPYWQGLCRSISLENLIDDPRFKSHEQRCLNNTALIQILEQTIANMTLEELAPRFEKEGVIWGLASTTSEIAEDHQVSENSYVDEVPHPQFNNMKLVTYPVKLRGLPKRPFHLGPELGQHTEEILLELGYSWEDISSLKERQVII